MDAKFKASEHKLPKDITLSRVKKKLRETGVTQKNEDYRKILVSRQMTKSPGI